MSSITHVKNDNTVAKLQQVFLNIYQVLPKMGISGAVDSQIKEYVPQAVGSSSTSLVDDIVDKVKEIGLEKPSDFQYMDESDLDCLGLKKIQLWKLLKSWEDGNISLLHHAVLILAQSLTTKSQDIYFLSPSISGYKF